MQELSSATIKFDVWIIKVELSAESVASTAEPNFIN